MTGKISTSRHFCSFSRISLLIIRSKKRTEQGRSSEFIEYNSFIDYMSLFHPSRPTVSDETASQKKTTKNHDHNQRRIDSQVGLIVQVTCLTLSKIVARGRSLSLINSFHFSPQSLFSLFSTQIYIVGRTVVTHAAARFACVFLSTGR